MSGPEMSPNLALDQLVARRTAAGASIVHLGFGESRLPVLPELVGRLVQGASRNGYGPVAGSLAVRDAIAGYFTRRQVPTDADQIVVGPGSKPLLLALQLVVPGDVVLPKPSWVTYAPQVRMAGKTPLGAPIPAECGGVPDPDALRETIRVARANGANPRIVVLTLPDNPTGTVPPPHLVREVCAVAENEDLLVISDEIYRDLVHDPATPVLGPAEVIPHRTVVLTGLSKNLALGGWRVGAARFPANADGERIRDGVTSVASDVWSTLAGPMQAVAEYAFAEPPEVVARIAADARLHGTVARAVHEIVTSAGALCRPPAAAFYVYPDFEPAREPLARIGVTDGASLQRYLLEDLGIAVLSGHHFGDDADALRFRAATSVLYGTNHDDQRATQLAEDPLRLPHIAEALAEVERAFQKLASV